MTVREHMKAAGFDLAFAHNAKRFECGGVDEKHGTMECEEIQIRTFRCVPVPFEEMLAVEATAIVPFTDGTMRPYPCLWPKSLEASITAYFPIKEKK